MPKSEAFTLELSARMAVRACAFCIESGDDLGPFCIGFGRVNWVGGDGSLMGPFFHCGLGLFKDVKKKNFQPSFRNTTLPTTSRRLNSKIERQEGKGL